MLKLSDVCEKTGAYWEGYQRRRRRDKIVHDPDTVPSWYVIELAGERVSEARIALERHGLLSTWSREVHLALWKVEKFLRFRYSDHADREMVVAGLLGAAEVEEDRVRRELGYDPPEEDQEETYAAQHDSLVDYARSLEQTRDRMLAAVSAAYEGTTDDTPASSVRRLLVRILDEFDPIESSAEATRDDGETSDRPSCATQMRLRNA